MIFFNTITLPRFPHHQDRLVHVNTEQTVRKARNPSQRGVDSVSRKINATKRRLSAQEKADTISDFTALEKYCRSLDNMCFTKRDDHILLVEFSNEIPPVHTFSIVIHEIFSVHCFKSSYRIPVRSHFGFSARLEKYSQLRVIIDYMRSYVIDSTDSAVMFGTQLEELLENNTDDDDELRRHILFLCEQLQMLSSGHILTHFDPLFLPFPPPK